MIRLLNKNVWWQTIPCNWGHFATVANYNHILRTTAICQNRNKTILPYKYFFIQNNIVEELIEGKSNQLKSQWAFLSIHLIYNINQVNVPYRHKHEILSEKVIIFISFNLKMSASNLVCKYLYSF